jgi:hypothetical protein
MLVLNLLRFAHELRDARRRRLLVKHAWFSNQNKGSREPVDLTERLNPKISR